MTASNKGFGTAAPTVLHHVNGDAKVEGDEEVVGNFAAGAIDSSPIGGSTPAAGAFTTLKASTDPADEHGVGDRGFNDARYTPKDLDATTSTNPAINAAVTTAIINAYGGVIITLTGVGNAQTLQPPTDTAAIKRFIVVTDDANGAFTIEVNGITLSASEAQWFIWDGSAWVTITAVDADDIAFTPVGDIVATNVQAAIAEVDTDKAAKGVNADITSMTGLDDDGIPGAKVVAASFVTEGVSELATEAETIAGTDAGRVITPDTLAYALQRGTMNYVADAEASDTYVITLVPALAAYVTGQVISFKANTVNTGACTLNVNGLGAKAIKKLHDVDPASGDIEAGQIVTLVYDGANFQMQSQVATPGDVTAAANITANAIVVGDGGAKGVKSLPSAIADTTLSGTPVVFTLYDSAGTPYYFKAYPTKV